MKTYAIIESDLRYDCASDLIAHLTTPQDLVYSQKYSRKTRQDQSLLARAILRLGLAEQTETNPFDWEIYQGHDSCFRADHMGGAMSFYVSISHSKSKVVVAWSEKHRIGVDIEWLDPKRNMNAILYQISHAHADIPEDMTEQYRLWTMYEAHFKATTSDIVRIPVALYQIVCRKPYDYEQKIIVDEDNFIFQSWIQTDYVTSICFTE